MSLPARQHYPAEFARLASALPGAADAWLSTQRREAMARFAASGFPEPRAENWKYTDLRPLELRPLPLAGTAAAPDTATLAPFLLPALDGHRLVFVNGRYMPALSGIGPLPAGARLGSLAAGLEQPDERLRAQLGSILNGDAGPLGDLNTAFMADGLHLDLADGVALDRPVHVLFYADAAALIPLRNLVRLGRGSEAVLIEHYAGADGSGHLTSSVTELQLEAGAQLTRCRLQQESGQAWHLGSAHARQAQDSRLHLHGVDLGSRLARSDTSVRLDGRGAEALLHGLYAPAGRQHMDNHTRIEHMQPQGTSREHFRGVLDGHGRGVFNGRIVVHAGAQKTDSQQNSAALLLSKHAEVDAKPELEIYADDVRCAHGATVGQLDEEAVFYLQSRGVDEPAARSLLTYSFADEIIREAKIEPLRRHVETQFLSRLPGGSRLRGLL